MEKVCENCGDLFEGDRSTRRFCSDRCRAKFYRRYHLWNKGNKELLTKQCVVCGKEFQTYKTRKTTCSKECSEIRHNTTHPDKRDKEKRRIYDRNKYLRNHPGALTAEERREKQRKIRDEKETQRKAAQIARETEWARIRAEKEQKKQENIEYWLNYKAEHQCEVCGNKFIAYYPTTKYCSDKCRKAKQRPKKRYKGITIDSDISLFKLAERDHNQCQICGLFVNWNDYIKTDTATICGDMYPSIDHIRPISLGGLHSWDNVQLAHRGCNTRKCNRYIG